MQGLTQNLTGICRSLELLISNFYVHFRTDLFNALSVLDSVKDHFPLANSMLVLENRITHVKACCIACGK